MMIESPSSRRQKQRLGRSIVRNQSQQAGFTIIEILVVVSIISLLLSILLPTFSKARSSMKELKCASNMRSTVVNFILFADGLSETGQGDSEKLGPKYFRMGDFQESVYGIDEFWDVGALPAASLGTNHVLACPSNPGVLTKRKGFPCGKKSLQPVSEVSVAFNMRLHRAPMEVRGKQLLAPVALTRVPSNVIERPYVPVLFDVDSKRAVGKGVEPFYAAPPLVDEADAYQSGRYWSPSTRHNGKTNVAFIGGHVLSSSAPKKERWNWRYHAKAGR